MTIRIAIDAMGGDYAPCEIIKGAILAAHEYGVALQLVGRRIRSIQNLFNIIYTDWIL